VWTAALTKTRTPEQALPFDEFTVHPFDANAG
jgi:hypothetical protein